MALTTDHRSPIDRLDITVDTAFGLLTRHYQLPLPTDSRRRAHIFRRFTTGLQSVIDSHINNPRCLEDCYSREVYSLKLAKQSIRQSP